MTIPLSFVSLYNGQEVFVWSDCLLDLGTDFLVGNMIMDPHSTAPKKNTSHEMGCYRKILHISYKDHVTNEKVRAKIKQKIGPHKDLLTIVKRRKLQWSGHVSRSSGLAKTILQGTVKGGRRQGGQRKRWEDNICLLYTSPSPRDPAGSRMPSYA